MFDWYPQTPSEFMVIYASVIALALLGFFNRRPRKLMRLRLRGSARGMRAAVEGASMPMERPLNVMFNYNGHSWDAYEVLGLPAGSSLEKVEEGFAAVVKTVDAGSRPFLEAAYNAIRTQEHRAKASSN
jgi:hypothetical protein